MKTLFFITLFMWFAGCNPNPQEINLLDFEKQYEKDLSILNFIVELKDQYGYENEWDKYAEFICVKSNKFSEVVLGAEIIEKQQNSTEGLVDKTIEELSWKRFINPGINQAVCTSGRALLLGAVDYVPVWVYTRKTQSKKTSKIYTTQIVVLKMEPPE